jgi:hypothetical protein
VGQLVGGTHTPFFRVCPPRQLVGGTHTPPTSVCPVGQLGGGVQPLEGGLIVTQDGRLM